MAQTSKMADVPAEVFVEMVGTLSSLGLAIVDVHGLIRSWNLGAELATGYKAKDAIGHALLGLIPNFPFSQGDLNSASDFNTQDFETSLTRLDGTVVQVKLTTRPIADAFHLVQIEDVTDRVAVERTSQQLVALIEHSHDLIAIATLDGKITYMNASGQKMIGVANEEDLSTLQFTDYVPPEYLGFFKETVLKTARDKGHWEGEMQLRNMQTGNVLDVMRSAFLIRDQNRGECWYATVTRDITERKRTEAARREVEERYRRLVDVLPNAVLIFANERIVFCNPACVQLFGARSEEELIGKSPFDIFHPDEHDLARHRIEQMLRTHEAVPSRRKLMVRVDGSSFPVQIVSTPFQDRGVQAILVCMQDLTEREQSVNVLQSIMNSVNDAIITIDSSGNIQSANIATERMFGYSIEELLGNGVSMLMPPHYQLHHDQYLANYLKTRVPKIIGIGRELEGMHKDSHQFPIELSVTEFSLHGEHHFSGVIRDITARKSLESQFRQSQKMEVVGRLAGGIAHDFNNILTIINSYSEVLALDLPPESHLRDYVQAISEAGDRAARLTKQLLVYSRKAIVELKPLNLNGLIANSTKLLRRLIGEDILLTVEPFAKIDLIEADYSQIEQTIMNLVVNARDAMPRGGEIKIKTENITVRSSATDESPTGSDGRYIQLSISDTGIGMTEEVMKQIFEPFFTTKDVGIGSGIGLAIVNEAVKQYGGSIRVESEVGVGTKFAILLPSFVDQEEQKSLAKSQKMTRGTEKILIVEDDVTLRRLIRLSLEVHGYRVLEAASGEEAIQTALQHQDELDLLITDVVMPKVSGREVAESVRAIQPRIRVLYISGYMDDAIIRHGIETSTEIFLPKPFTPQMLSEKVRSVLDQING